MPGARRKFGPVFSIRERIRTEEVRIEHFLKARSKNEEKQMSEGAAAPVGLTESRSQVAIESNRQTVMQVTWSLVAGGAEMYALTIASNLDGGKYRSIMCAIDEGGALEDEIKQTGIPHFVMNRRPGIDLRLMWRLYRLFRKMKVDVIQTHHFNQLFYSAIGARLAGARIIHTEHSVECFKRRKLRVALRLLSVLCDKVIAIGNDGEQVLHKQVGIPACKLEIIRAGIDPLAFNESKSLARRALSLGETDRVAVIVARLFPEKNHRLLLRAFADVARRVKGARLLIVGEGVEGEAIGEEIKKLNLTDHVRMMGVRRDIARILAASDVFVLSSDREGLPIAALEAMCAGLPVVATSVGDMPKIVIESETGRLVAPGNSVGMAQALIDLFEDPKRASEMGARGRRFATENFGLQSMIERLEAIYSGR